MASRKFSACLHSFKTAQPLPSGGHSQWDAVGGHSPAYPHSPCQTSQSLDLITEILTRSEAVQCYSWGQAFWVRLRLSPDTHGATSTHSRRKKSISLCLLPECLPPDITCSHLTKVVQHGGSIAPLTTLIKTRA